MVKAFFLYRNMFIVVTVSALAKRDNFFPFATAHASIT